MTRLPASMRQPFPPTLQAARERIAAVQPGAYARSRNHLDGAVTRLSPYLTHGVVALPEVLQAIAGRHALPLNHKLVQEFAWRAFFHHVWRHRGDGIFSSIHDGPRPEAAYAAALLLVIIAKGGGKFSLDRVLKIA